MILHDLSKLDRHELQREYSGSDPISIGSCILADILPFNAILHTILLPQVRRSRGFDRIHS